jgi:cytochrome bd-type quinol oxidase subunit 2
MKTTEEKILEIKRREAAIRDKRWKRQMAVYGCASAAACLMLIVAAADFLNGIKIGAGMSPVRTEFGSIFAMSRMGSMVLMIVFAFALGVCVTLLFVRLHDRNERRKKL